MVKKRRLSEANLPAKKRALIRRDSDEVPNEDVKQKLGNEGNDRSGDNKTTAQGRALVSVVSRFYDDDGKWYSGIIADYRTIRGRSEHQIVYDVDGGAVMRTVDQAQSFWPGVPPRTNGLSLKRHRTVKTRSSTGGSFKASQFLTIVALKIKQIIGVVDEARGRMRRVRKIHRLVIVLEHLEIMVVAIVAIT